MRCEWPICKRCCFFIPLRYGLLVWAYIKMLLSLSMLIYILVVFVSRLTLLGYSLISYYVTDCLIQLVFIVGAHTKHYKIFRFYLYYGFVVLLIGVVELCVIIGFSVQTIVELKLPVDMVPHMLELPISQLVSIALNVYLLILVRSEMIKLRDNHQLKFVNNVVEADCTVTMDHGLYCARRDGSDPTNAIHSTLVIEDNNTRNVEENL